MHQILKSVYSAHNINQCHICLQFSSKLNKASLKEGTNENIFTIPVHMSQQLYKRNQINKDRLINESKSLVTCCIHPVLWVCTHLSGARVGTSSLLHPCPPSPPDWGNAAWPGTTYSAFFPHLNIYGHIDLWLQYRSSFKVLCCQSSKEK